MSMGYTAALKSVERFWFNMGGLGGGGGISGVIELFNDSGYIVFLEYLPLL